MFLTREPSPPPPILRGSNNNHHLLPDDMVFDILVKLPVKSILRCRSLCKFWDSSITSPYFISTHVNNNNNKDDDDNDDDHGYIINMLRPNKISPSNTFDMIYEVGIPLDFRLYGQIVGSCNGLLCLAGCGCGIIYLWNPSIRKFKKLPNSCLGPSIVTLGFAYHSQNNDYKVVRISRSFLSTPFPSVPEIEVYTLSSDSWRRVEISLRTDDIRFNHNNFNLPTPFVSGALHWMACITEEKDKRGEEIIVSFDVNTEKFREIAVPDPSAPSYKSCLALFKGKLAFITYGGGSEQLGHQYSIWVMRDYGVHDYESWNKLFVAPSQSISLCTAFTQYSLMIGYLKYKKEFKCFLIDTATLHEWDTDTDFQYPSCVATFMESLTLLDRDGADMVSY